MILIEGNRSCKLSLSICLKEGLSSTSIVLNIVFLPFFLLREDIPFHAEMRIVRSMGTPKGKADLNGIEAKWNLVEITEHET